MIKPFLSVSLLGLAAASPVPAASLINLNFSGAMGAVEQQTFVDAAAYWNSTIIGYELTYLYSGFRQPHQLTIDVSLPYIDGACGILGSAGPTEVYYYFDAPFATATEVLIYASAGAMEFDSADVETMVANNLFYGVVLHEMAHVLGIGTLWTLNGLYTADSGQYHGPAALAAWRSEFGQTAAAFVPVELGGGPGTANGHWNEVNGGGGNTGIVSSLTGMDLANELMTGWAGDSFFVSTLTLGGLADLGYLVDYSKAGPVHYVQVAAVPEPTSVLATAGRLAGGLMTRRRGAARRVPRA
jgi:hypothetical protein